MCSADSAKRPTAEPLFDTSQLKARGWTASLITRFLKEPDERRPVPHHPSGPQKNFYKQRRVKRAEKSAKFQAALAKSPKRREDAQSAVVTKRAKLAAYAADLEIEIPCLDKQELICQACAHYNQNRRDADMSGASPDSAPDFLDRICVNFLRHRLSKYEVHLDRIAGKVGASDEYLTVKSKVLQAIADQYDWLGDECDRQEAKMIDDYVSPDGY